MKTATIEEVVKSPEQMLAGKESVVVTQDGKATSVVFPLHDPQAIPLEIRRRLYAETSAEVSRQLGEKGISQEQIERDIEDLLRKDRH